MPAPLVTAILALAFLVTTLNSIAAVAVGVVGVIIQLVVNNAMIEDEQ